MTDYGLPAGRTLAVRIGGLDLPEALLQARKEGKLVVFAGAGVSMPPPSNYPNFTDLAYLTEGWARIFLQRVFETFTVLFVGYSHDDPPMNYIARGFTPEMGKGRRFALIPAGEEERWTYRGVVPVAYRLAVEPMAHSAVSTGLAAWAEQARFGMLEKEQRIRTIVSLPPPIDREDGDFVLDAFSEVSTTRFFANYADSVLWMKWVEEKKLLRRLFDPTATITEVDAELAWWLLEKFLCQYAGETLSLVRRQGQRLNPYFWNRIGHKLSQKWTTEENRDALRRWVAVLTILHPTGTDCEPLEYIAAKFSFPEDIEVALIVFEYLTRPMLRLKHDLWGEINENPPRENIRFELKSNGGGFWLDHLWLRFFQPNLDKLSHRLEPVIMSQLELAYVLSNSDKGIAGAWDTLSLSRSLIEERDNGRQNGGLGVLIDAAYDVITWNATNRPEKCDALIELWFSGYSFLLKRLAIFAVSLCKHT